MSLFGGLSVLVQEAGEHEAALLGIPMWIWQLVNLAAFLAVLFYLVAKPLTKVFRDRQLAVEDRLKCGRRTAEDLAEL